MLAVLEPFLGPGRFVRTDSVNRAASAVAQNELKCSGPVASRFLDLLDRVPGKNVITRIDDKFPSERSG